jgi:hypothetical protein
VRLAEEPVAIVVADLDPRDPSETAVDELVRQTLVDVAPVLGDEQRCAAEELAGRILVAGA